MNDLPTTPVLKQLVERSRRLYSLPAVALEVMALTDQPTVDARALKECIQRDPALTTRILRVVNSSLFGLSRQVSDLNQALALLGIKPLKMLVLGFSLPKALTDQVEATALRRYWQHTVVKAVACRLLSERVFHVPGDDAFIAGLLADIGQLVLIQDLGPPYLRFLEHVDQQQGDLLQLELDALGFDHSVLSSRLLDHWGLPNSLVGAVAAPHNADRILMLPPSEGQLPQILHLAELIARSVEHPSPQTLQRLLDAGQRYVSLDYAQLQELAAALQTQTRQLSDALAVELRDSQPYIELLQSAHERLAEVAADAALELLSLNAERQVLDQARDLRDQLAHVLARTGRSQPPPADAIPPNLASETESGPPLGETKPLARRPAALASTAADAGLLGRVSAAIAHCRVARRAVSLALVQIDDWNDAAFQYGPQQALNLFRTLETALSSWSHQRGTLLATGDGQFALVWEDCQRREALDLVRELQRCLANWQLPIQSAGRASAPRSGMTLSAGLATLTLPPKNFPPRELVEAARRCLSGALLSGGDTCKSIEF